MRRFQTCDSSAGETPYPWRCSPVLAGSSAIRRQLMPAPPGRVSYEKVGFLSPIQFPPPDHGMKRALSSAIRPEEPGSKKAVASMRSYTERGMASEWGVNRPRSAMMATSDIYAPPTIGSMHWGKSTNR